MRHPYTEDQLVQRGQIQGIEHNAKRAVKSAKTLADFVFDTYSYQK